MAVPISNVTRRQVYAPSGTGGAGPYAFTFEILANTDIAVFKDDTLLTLTTHYTVTINANGTGSVTITATGLALAPTSPTQYAIVGNRTIQRTTDFVTGGDFFANTLNDEMDQQTIFAQQNAEGVQRSLAAPQTDPTSINMTLPRASLRANKALGFDANGNPVISDTLGTNRGNWAAGVLYYVRDIVKDTTNNNIWQVITQHTSSGSQPINTNVDAAKWTLLVDAASATTSATNAAASASAASTSASNASTSASNASTSASNASTSASNASSSASAAATSASNAAASYDSFDDRYLGPKATAPTLDNDGNALLTGALYWDTVANTMEVWSGSAWVDVNASASNTRTAITATASQTVLSVATYTPGTNTMVVYVNGVKLNASEYTETNANTVTLTTGLALNDEVEVFSYQVNAVGSLGASSVTFTQAGTGATARNVQTKLQESVSTIDFGIPGDMTDDGSNHTRLGNAAKAAIAAKLPLKVVGKILVSDTVDWDTRGSGFNGLDQYISNGSGKNLSVIADQDGSGIYGKASAFTGTTKDVITLSTQSVCLFTGLTVRLYNNGAYTYSTMRGVKLVHVKGSDRLIIKGNLIGGMQENGTSVSIGAGIALWLEDVMSPSVLENDIQYYTRYGICVDGGSSVDAIATTETIRVSTSGLIEKNHFSGGWPSATSRNECVSINLSYGYTLVQNIFENNSKGRAIIGGNDNNVLIGNWFEGDYDTILMSSGFGWTFIGSFVIQYAPTNSVVEGYGSYSIAGVLAIGASNAGSLAKMIFLENGFYAQRAVLPSTTINGNLTLGNMTGSYFAFNESSADVNGVIGATNYPVFNDQSTFSVHNPVGGVTRYRMSSGGSAATTTNYLFDMYSNPAAEFVGLVVAVNQNKRITFDWPSNGGDAFYMSWGTNKYFQPAADNVAKLGDASYRWTTVYAATGTINTSDEREKVQIVLIDEAALRAWAKVKFYQFKFKDMVENKGNGARWHFGVIAQRVKEAFESEGLDAFAYGLLCYDEWEDEYDDVVIEEEYVNADGKKGVKWVPTGEKRLVKKAGNRYGIRYEEALALECAYLRSKLTM